MKPAIIFPLLLIFLALAAVANILFGAVDIPIADIFGAISGQREESIVNYIIIQNRLPQMVTAMLAGGSLAVSGLMLQTAFRNPLAGPSILGISSGASLGVALIMLMFGGVISLGGSSISGNIAVIIGALAGSILVTAILTAISLTVRNSLMLLIVGIMVGYLTSSIVTLLSSISTARSLQGYVMWGMGSFSDVALSQLPLFTLLNVVGILYSLTLAKPLNILLLGDNYAHNLGIQVSKVKTRLLVATGFLTAIVTAYCGPVAFIGLAMPHIARLLTRSDNHWILMPASMLCGAIVALCCNVASVAFTSSVIPLNALTPIVGVPVILYVILFRNK